MEFRKIENYKYFNIGSVMFSISLVLLFLPDNYENQIIMAGAFLGGWWPGFVKISSFLFLCAGGAAMGKAFNYKKTVFEDISPEK